MGKEMELLEHKSQRLVAQVGKCIVIKLLDGDAVEPVATTGWPIQAAKNVHSSALPRAARTHHRKVIPAVDGEIELIQRLDLKITLAVDLADATQFSDGVRG